MEKVKIQAPQWKIFLAVLGMIVFVALGVLMVFGDTSIFEKLVGILAVVFFGGFGSVAMYSTLIKGKGYVLITPELLELHFPACPAIPISWNDIEAFGVYEISGQIFNTIKLNNYENLLNSITPSDAEKIIKKFQAIKNIGYVTAAVGTLNLSSTGGLLDILPKSSELKNFAAFLNYSRNKFGGEFQISWAMRDRKATEFAAFLRKTKKQYTSLII